MSTITKNPDGSYSLDIKEASLTPDQLCQFATIIRDAPKSFDSIELSGRELKLYRYPLEAR